MMQNQNSQKVAVLGAGPMGLAVAYQLSKDGYLPVIFEADDRIGGMAASFNFDGVEIERFYHFYCTSDTALFDILKELGLESKLHWRKTKMAYDYQGKIYPWGNPIALLQFPKLNLLDKIRYGLHVFFSTQRNKWEKLDKLESTRWIKRWIGDKAFDILWRSLFELKFYHHAETLSAAWTWSRIRRVGRSRYNMFQEKLGYIDGGADTVMHAMRDFIEERGGTFRLSCPVEKVIIANQTVNGVQTKYGFEPFDKVISTIPLPYLPKILAGLPDEILSAYRNIDNIAIVCVVAKLRKPLTPYFWLNINDQNMEIPGLVEYTNLRQMEANLVYVPYYMPFEHPKFQRPNQFFLDEVKSYLQKINPSLTDADFLGMHASRYRYAQPVCTPEFLKRLPPIQLPVKGLWAADTSYYYPEDRGLSESFALA